jgi:hypothetical protein
MAAGLMMGLATYGHLFHSPFAPQVSVRTDSLIYAPW